MPKTNSEKIKDALLRDPTMSDLKIARNTHIPVHIVRAARASEVPSDGVLLQKLKVQSRKPAESAAKFIKRLPEGRGYCPKELSLKWGMSEDTIRKHARDLGCLKFVEISEDEWKPMVMHPTTAEMYV